MRTDRGGKLTYHGPGQLVGYPIMHVDDVIAFLRTMERAIIAALGEAGIEARSREAEGRDYTGVWVQDRKIASIGVHLSRGVSTHGFAVNVDNDLTPFGQVVACGLPDVRMTSIRAEGGTDSRRLLPQAHGPRVRDRVRPPPAARRGDPTRVDTLTGVTATPLRIHQTRSRSNPGGMDVTKVLGDGVRALPRPQAAVVQGAAARAARSTASSPS